MKTITFYSYKGGVGRSLCLANIAIRLSEFDKKVCLLDFDLEAPGLHYKFSSHYIDRQIENGIVDYLYTFTNEGRLPNSIIDFSYIFKNNQMKKDITLIPSGNINASNYWKMLSAINWNELLYEFPSGISLFLDLKEKIRTQIQPDFLLIDSRTGISEMSAITLSLLADDVVIVIANNKENLDGAKKIIKGLLNIDNNIIGKIPKVTLVLSRVPFTDKPEDKVREQNLVAKIKMEFQYLIEEINIIHSDRDLEENEQIKIGYQKDETVAQVSQDYLKLFEKLTINDLSPMEIMKFKDVKESERLYKKAVSEFSLTKKLEYIDKAIELDSTNIDFYLLRADIYRDYGQFDKSLEDCEKIIKMSPVLLTPYEIMGDVYSELKNYDKAEEVYYKLLEIDPSNSDAMAGLSVIYTIKQNYTKAIMFLEKYILLNPNDPFGYNGIGNIMRLKGDYKSAFRYIYKSLEVDAEFAIAYATLAELNAHINNFDEFYLNLEKSLQLDRSVLEYAINEEEIYAQFYNEKRFLQIMEKYDIHIENRNN